ncbi:hypothetical protein OCK74_21530 [Chitinophagaceae bacterium LB-8]|jgi:hypothetical protein|uniref:Uncharacterized protein n=1 Tax=Paraflavisolibacter caeni TaxID=2982496 RepID=A0A9X2XZS5_9BACT|nr:hypothetical protein [Paraflavisolibacter caeni]MCU7551717.1 hypothetical protein [Paraflavisolibacter caeni]
MEKIASFTIEVPYRTPGNRIINKNIDFDIFKDGNHYTAAPLCGLEERRIASLPPELSFEFKNGKPLSSRGIKEGNIEVINRIAGLLKEHDLINGT